MSAWHCVNCDAVIKPNDHEKPSVDWKPRAGEPGEWDGHCRECGVLAHKPKAITRGKPQGEPREAVACSATTKEGQPCPINADRVDEKGEAWCHVHDAKGNYRQNLRTRRTRASRRRDT